MKMTTLNNIPEELIFKIMIQCGAEEFCQLTQCAPLFRNIAQKNKKEWMYQKIVAHRIELGNKIVGGSCGDFVWIWDDKLFQAITNIITSSAFYATFMDQFPECFFREDSVFFEDFFWEDKEFRNACQYPSSSSEYFTQGFFNKAYKKFIKEIQRVIVLFALSQMQWV